ncbi:hypothetical protein ABEB36_013714 [Hypothenemus hampei]|uniref:FAR1 domain-containing protein n=1 Tax=Hypothenemus hampei TaxID=57062 RepID=A0ABD1E5D0_HYPHA
MSFQIGQKFNSYEELKTYIKEYENNVKQKFWKRSRRGIETINLKKYFNSKIFYYEIHHSCVHSGNYKTREKGLRKSSTQRMGCPAFIKFRADETGQALENFFDHLPQNRKLTEKGKQNARTYLELEGNKKKIQQQLYLETGTKTLLKDLRNIEQEHKKVDKENLECVKIIQEKHGGKVSILEEDTFFKGMFFITEYMQRNISDWPEFLVVNGTYKLLRNGCTVYILLIEDSNGESRVVGVGVLASEN